MPARGSGPQKHLRNEGGSGQRPLRAKSERPLHAMLGGAERDRTAGLLVANEALSQLSYSPTGDFSYLTSDAIFFEGYSAPSKFPLLLRSRWRNWPGLS